LTKTLTKILIFIISIFFSENLLAQGQANFQLYAPANGLSRNVRSIIQDSFGFLWIGTEDGLFKFDGYTYKAYYHEPGNKNSLSNSTIQQISLDSKGNIWIATQNGGVNCLNPLTDSVKQYLTTPDYETSLNCTYALCTYEDRNGSIWFGTQGGGLYRIMNDGVNLENFRPTENRGSISDNQVCSIYQDYDGDYWIGTHSGINIFDYKTKKFTLFLPDTALQQISVAYNYRIMENPKGTIWFATQNQGIYKYIKSENKLSQYKYTDGSVNTLQNNSINDLVFDSKGYLWIASDGGVGVLDTLTNKIITYKAVDKNENALSANNIWDICLDKSGILWFAAVGGDGMHRLLPKKKFDHFYFEANNPNSLSGKIVRSIFVDSEGIIWMSTTEEGLNSYNPQTNIFLHYNDKQFASTGLSNNFFSCCFENKDGKLWFGTWNDGILVYDRKTKKSIRYSHSDNDPESLGDSRVQFIHSDKEGNIWIGTDGSTLSKYVPETNKFLNFKHNPKDSTSINWGGLQSQTFYEDNNGNIWFGSWGGITIFNKKTYKSICYNSQNTNLSDDRVISTYGTDSIIWFGTYGGGLNKFDTQTKTFTAYLERHGLTNNTIFAILPDEDGNLWLSTINGLSKFNIKTEKFENYTKEDGIQENEFYWGAAFKDKTGKLYFGGVNGVTAFYPKQIVANQNIPSIVITNFKIFNKTVIPNAEGSPLTKSISLTKEIELSSKQYIISFDFVVIDYVFPSKNKYAYKMEGFDNDWVYTDLHEVTYMNLKPGKYIFRVKGANSDGTWNDAGVQIIIKINPPFWNTLWFKISIPLFLTLSILLFFNLRIRVINAKKKELELLVNQRTAELNKEKEQLKNANYEIILINTELKQQKEEITAQRDNIEEQNEILLDKNFEIQKQNYIIEKKNHAITESINYAAKIQQAILTPKSLIEAYLKNCFVLYRPKDIISGDFYYVKQLNNYVIITVADCTGHGVPGAFMSILGITLLNEQLRDKSKLENPHLILEEMRKEIILSLRQTREFNSTKDGMDIGLCVWDTAKNVIYFAAAYHRLILVRNNEMLEFKGDKMPIGIHILHNEKFTSEKIELQKNDSLYMFTDGYADQFNEKLKEKFYLKNLKKLILNNSNLTLPEQQKCLETAIDNWKGNAAQVDDILIVGWQI